MSLRHVNSLTNSTRSENLIRWKLIGSCLLVLAMFAFTLPSISNAQTVPPGNTLVSEQVKTSIDSGRIFHNGEKSEVVWEEVVTVDDAKWMRLNFSQLALAGNPLGGPSSTLRITSMTDKAVQLLNAETATQWRNTSAYFNGNSVKLELLAAPNGRMNLIVIDDITSGLQVPPNVTETICDDVDDRVPSSDPRVGRTGPGGCTAWLFNDRANCMITAGHCAPSTEVVMFNVPLSDSSGNPQFPGPEDQYAVDFDSLQAVAGGGGNDWCYFGCFPNSTTGLSAFQAQGQSFVLSEPAEVEPGGMIRITGFGSTSFPVDPTLNGAQKTQAGEYVSATVNQLGYRTDTTGGNSGSPIIFEETGEAIGVHTNGGCGNGGGQNTGTASTQAGFATALLNPLGICLQTVEFDFPNSLPQFVSPQGGDTVSVIIDDSEFPAVAATAMLHVQLGNEFQAIPMTSVGDDTYEATFPSSKCATILRYYFSIESADDGELFTNPLTAPLMTYAAISADSITVQLADNFETDQGWSVSGRATDGQWERGIPAGGGERGDPPTDADGSGFCFVTDNEEGNSDVDNGDTILTSPMFDTSDADIQDAVVSYFRWFTNDSNGDSFAAEVSNDAGATWVTMEQFENGPNSAGGWLLQSFALSDFIGLTNQMQVRFVVSDFGSADVVEAGIDAFSVQLVDCQDVLLGDINRDGSVNLLDVDGFVELLIAGQFQLEADINGDGAVNLLDVSLFVALLAG